MIEIKELRAEVSGFALSDINLRVKEGEFFILLGPTGSGKTLVLEAITGTGPMHGGSIRLKGRDITGLPPERRGVGIVYQDYALFPHLTVMQNITYGLRYQNAKGIDSDKWVGELIRKLGLGAICDRSVTFLSGGEKQRVSLARSLAVNPSVLLLDEPLSALDPNFREDIREILKKLHREMEITFLMVTHDFSEALFLGERTAVLNKGRIEQTGTVSEVFTRPATPFVAEFVGMKNVLPATFSGDRAFVEEMVLRLAADGHEKGSFVAIRSEDIMLSRKKEELQGANQFSGRVQGVTDQGLYHEVSVRSGTVRFVALLSKGDLLRLGLAGEKDIYLSIPESSIHVI